MSNNAADMIGNFLSSDQGMAQLEQVAKMLGFGGGDGGNNNNNSNNTATQPPSQNFDNASEGGGDSDSNGDSNAQPFDAAKLNDLLSILANSSKNASSSEPQNNSVSPNPAPPFDLSKLNSLIASLSGSNSGGTQQENNESAGNNGPDLNSMMAMLSNSTGQSVQPGTMPNSGGINLAAMLSMLNGMNMNTNTNAGTQNTNSVSGFDLSKIDAAKVMKIISLASTVDMNSKEVVFLRSLAPLLKNSRHAKIERVIKILQLYSVWKVVSKSGLLDDFLGSSGLTESFKLGNLGSLFRNFRL